MNEENETTRVEAFTDAVFAIAIMLLVLEIKVPSHEAVAVRGLIHALSGQWPSYLAYLTSFVTILVIWVRHHWIFALIRKTDHILLYMNGLLLLAVTSSLSLQHCWRNIYCMPRLRLRQPCIRGISR